MTTDDEGSDRSGQAQGEIPIAFFLAHPRDLTATSSRESNQPSSLSSSTAGVSFYVYLAAIDARVRGQRLFPLLVESVKRHAFQLGYASIAIGTIPARFPRMYSILSKEGSGWEVVEWKVGEDGLRKVVMKMILEYMPVLV